MTASSTSRHVIEQTHHATRAALTDFVEHAYDTSRRISAPQNRLKTLMQTNFR